VLSVVGATFPGARGGGRYKDAVDVARVTLEVGRDAERALAPFTPVRLFTGVRPQVTRQVRRPREHLAAVATPMSPARR